MTVHEKTKILTQFWPIYTLFKMKFVVKGSEYSYLTWDIFVTLKLLGTLLSATQTTKQIKNMFKMTQPSIHWFLTLISCRCL